jgi:hypothetical protein
MLYDHRENASEIGLPFQAQTRKYRSLRTARIGEKTRFQFLFLVDAVAQRKGDVITETSHSNLTFGQSRSLIDHK